MGRVSEFIYYLNREKEPTPLEKMTEYTHISFTEDINKIGKDYRRAMKKRKGETMSNKIIMAIAELEDGREHIHAKHNKPEKYDLGSISDLQVLDNYSKRFIEDQSMCYSKDLTCMYSTKGTPENERTMVKSMRYEPYDETLHIPYRTFGVLQETEKGEKHDN